MRPRFPLCRGGETADAVDSKSTVRKDMRVQVPPSAPQQTHTSIEEFTNRRSIANAARPRKSAKRSTIVAESENRDCELSSFVADTSRACGGSGRVRGAALNNRSRRVIARTRITGRDDHEVERAKLDVRDDDGEVGRFVNVEDARAFIDECGNTSMRIVETNCERQQS